MPVVRGRYYARRQTKAQAKAAALERVHVCAFKWREGRATDEQLAYSIRHALGTADRAQIEAYADLTPAQLDALISDH